MFSRRCHSPVSIISVCAYGMTPMMRMETDMAAAIMTLRQRLSWECGQPSMA